MQNDWMQGFLRVIATSIVIHTIHHIINEGLKKKNFYLKKNDH